MCELQECFASQGACLASHEAAHRSCRCPRIDCEAAESIPLPSLPLPLPELSSGTSHTVSLELLHAVTSS